MTTMRTATVNDPTSPLHGATVSVLREYRGRTWNRLAVDLADVVDDDGIGWTVLVDNLIVPR